MTASTSRQSTGRRRRGAYVYLDRLRNSLDSSPIINRTDAMESGHRNGSPQSRLGNRNIGYLFHTTFVMLTIFAFAGAMHHAAFVTRLSGGQGLSRVSLTNYPINCCWEMKSKASRNIPSKNFFGSLLMSSRSSASDTEVERDEKSGFDDEDEWRTILAAFQMYKAAYGDLKVPSRFVVPAMAPWPEPAWRLKLGQRVAAIRSTGKYVQNNEGRRKVLDDMGFLWRLRAPSPDKKLDGVAFDQVYDALKTYREVLQPKGKLDVPSTYVVPDCEPWPVSTRGLPLGKILPTVRSKAYLKSHPDAEAKLNSLGFGPDSKAAANDVRYQRVYDALVKYKELYGDLLVPQPFTVPEDSDEWPEEVRGLRLGARVNAIRSQGTFVKTDPSRKEELDALGFVWEPPANADGKRRGRKKKSETDEGYEDDESNNGDDDDDDDDSSDDENKENELSPRESKSSHEVDNESKESRDIDGIVVAEENISSLNKVSASIENIHPLKKLETDNLGSIPRPKSIYTGECSESVNRVSPEESLSPKTNLTTIDSSTEQSKAEGSTSHCNISQMSEIAPDQLSSNMTPLGLTRSTVRTDICDAEPVENLTNTQLPLKTTRGESNENNHSSNSSVTASSKKRENESSGKSSTLSSIADDDEASANGVEAPSSNGSDHISKEVVKSQIDGVKFPVGCKVFVEYRHIFYSSTILKTRKKKTAHEYLVHYQGYKKASNRWVKVDTLHEVNEATTKRYEEQRLIPADILYGTDQTEFSMVTRRKKAAEESNSSPSKLKHRGSRIDISELADIGDIEPGVAFLPGSVVFVEWSGALYLAKMLKKRFSGDRMEYMVSYDGYESDFDAWVSIHKIYEVDHQSKKVFKRLKSDMLPQPPPGPKRETRSSLEAETLAAPTPKRESRRKKEDDIISDFELSSKANGEVRQVESQIDMQGIPSGVEFLPGSTLFAERNRSLCLAKMLKKRGKGDYMEYFIQYMGLKKEETRWISTALVFEINPQTKRMYRLYSGKKKS
mmetsp:Transcript_24956/g.51534  ORF Transcript_24956/g.51534 Transcript_24956/m.51534 type:complete len:1011 (+) Transcript_24956:265-3297(+)